MIVGKVIGEVWATKKNPRIEGRKLMLVAVLKESDQGMKPTGQVVVAVDEIGAKVGHYVTVSWGSGARSVIKEPDNRWVLADAAISRIVEAFTQEELETKEVKKREV